MLAVTLKIVAPVDIELFWQQPPSLKSKDTKKDFLYPSFSWTVFIRVERSKVIYQLIFC